MTAAAGDGSAPRSVSTWVATDRDKVPALVAALRLTKRDVLYDLGCGDGTVIVEVARTVGCKCVGLDIDEKLLEAAAAAAARAGVDDLVTVEHCDLLTAPPAELLRREAGVATAVYVYMEQSGLRAVSEKLRPAWRAGRCRVATNGTLLVPPGDGVYEGKFFVVPPFGITAEQWLAAGKR